jgi:hypothetical protein
MFRRFFLLGGEFLVKIYGKDGKETKFDSKDVEDNLKAAGLPERVAQEVAERVETRIADGWTTEKLNEEIDVELRRLQEDIDRAHATYKGSTSMGAYNVGETRTWRESDNSPNAQPRSETKVECRNVEG